MATSAFGQVNLLDADPESPTFNNPSFERPDTTFVSIVADAWELTGPKVIVDIPPFGSVPITAGCGVFENPEPEDPQRLTGAEGSQIAYIYGNSFQSAEPGDPTVDHAFTQVTQLTLQAGKAYELMIAFANATAVAPPESVLTMSLFAYDSGNPSVEVLLASDTLTSSELNGETLLDFTAATLPISGGSIGKQLGIRISTHTNPLVQYPTGQFDFDNVRVYIPLYWDGNGSGSGAGAAPAGTWGTSSNWTTSSAGTSATAAYSGDLTTSVFFSAGSDATGNFTVTVSGTQSAGSLSFQEGAVTLTGGQINLGGGQIDVAVGSSATIGSVIAGASGLHKSGAGTLILTAANSYTGQTSVAAGKLVLESNLTSLSSISVTGDGMLDLKDNKLITQTPIAAITALIATGRNGGAWDGPGITTSMTDATGGSGYTVLGVASGSEARGIGLSDTDTWAGQTVTGGDTLVMYTYGGDANLSGNVDVDDYGQIDFNASTGGSLTGWFNGDFDYNGFQDVDDYGIIDFVVGIQGAPFPTGAGPGPTVSSVPEPTTIGLTALSGAMGLRRRRR